MPNYIFLDTSHGRFQLSAYPNESIESILRRFDIPISAVWTYTYDERTESERMISIRDIPEKHDNLIFAQITRNIDLQALIKPDSTYLRSRENPSTEWIFPDVTHGAFRKVLSEMSSEECIGYVQKVVDDFVARWLSKDLKMIVGVSGGGDSNVMLSCLMNSPHVVRKNIIPAMILSGLPDWDSQLDQALELCRKLSVDLEIITSEQAASLLGVTSLSDLQRAFRTFYPEIDLDFLGTWVIRKVLFKYANQKDINYIAIGANREDLLSEAIAQISIGRLPLPLPHRKIGLNTIVYPMWQVPKKIGDGAYPKYSLKNYENRGPGNTKGRSLFYYIAYKIADLAPGFDQTFLNGLSNLSTLNNDAFQSEDLIEDYTVVGLYSQEELEKWKQMLDSVSPIFK